MPTNPVDTDASVQLNPGESVSGTLEWTTVDGDVGDWNAEVRSVDDTAVVAVTVDESDGVVTGTAQSDGGATLSGATVRGINDTQGTVEGTTTTNSAGDFGMAWPASDEGHFTFEHDDGSTQYVAASQPFYNQQPDVPAYIQNKGVFWLPFGEGSGTTSADALGNGHDASITGATWSSGTWVDGTTLSYDGVDDISSVSHHTDLNVANADFAIAATVSVSSSPGQYRGVAIKYIQGGSRTPHYGFYLHNDDTYNFRVRDSGGTAAHLTQAITLSQPMRLVGVRSGDDFSLYVNNSLVDSATVAVGDPANTDNFNIGRYYTTASMDGFIDDVILFNSALTTQEIADDYARQPWS